MNLNIENIIGACFGNPLDGVVVNKNKAYVKIDRIEFNLVEKQMEFYQEDRLIFSQAFSVGTNLDHLTIDFGSEPALLMGLTIY